MKKLAKILIFIVIVAAVVFGYRYFSQTSTVTMEMPAVIENTSEYDERVESKMKATADDWVDKHKVWAEQEVSKEIIAEQEEKLIKLREKELSL